MLTSDFSNKGFKVIKKIKQSSALDSREKTGDKTGCALSNPNHCLKIHLNLCLKIHFNLYFSLLAIPTSKPKTNLAVQNPPFLQHSPGWWNNIHPLQSSACWGCRSEWCTGCWTAGVGGSPSERCKSGWAGNHQQRPARFWWFWWHWRCACCTWWCRPIYPEGHAWSPSQWYLWGEKKVLKSFQLY